MEWTTYEYKGFRVEIDAPEGDERSGWAIEWRVRDRDDRTVLVAQGVHEKRLPSADQAIHTGKLLAQASIEEILK